MPSLTRYAAAVSAAVAAWLLGGALALQSAAPGAPKLGIVPPLWHLALFAVAAGCAVFLLKPGRDRLLPLFATLLCVLPWLPGVRVPALLVWTGPLAAALWLGAVTAMLGSTRWPPAFFALRWRGRAPGPLAAGVAALVLFGVVAYGAREMVPGGDEPHYLIITQSLLADRDIQIENNHARGDYAPYFQGTLRPDYFVRGKNGAIYSIHAPGLSVLIAPAWALAGYRGVVVFLLAVAASGIALLWVLAHQLTRSRAAAWFGAAAMAAATPIAFHSFTIYPDGPGAVLVLTGIWAIMRLRPTGTSHVAPGTSHRTSHVAWLLHGLALAALPWLHARFAVLAGLIGLFVLLRMPRTRAGVTRAAAFLAVPIASAIAWFAYFWVIYGTPNPNAPYGEFFRTQASWSFVTGGIAGVLFDQQFGILVYAPVFLVAAAGFISMMRSDDRRLAIELAILVTPYVVTMTHLRMWWGGWSAPARFAVAILWLGGVFAAHAWSVARTRAARGTALGALGASLFATLTLALVDGGRLAYNVRDGYSLWLEWLSPLGDLPLGMPSFFRWVSQEGVYDLQILAVGGLFLGAFVALRAIDRRIRGNGAFALALLVAYAVAGMAALTILWRINGSDGLRPASAQARVLRAAQEDRRVALDYVPPLVRARTVDQAIDGLRLETPPRTRAGSEGSALVLPGWFPAGTYRLEADAAAGQPVVYEVRVLRSGPPILQATAAPAAHLVVNVKLPVDTPALILRGAGLQSAFLAPVHVATRRERFPNTRAQSARAYGGTIVWFLDGNAFNEPDGLWIRGRSRSRIVLQPRSGQSARVLLRNGPTPNDVQLETASGEWRQALALKPDEEREVQVPVDPLRGAALLGASSRSGFRPSDVDRQSRDARLLGVYLVPR